MRPRHLAALLSTMAIAWTGGAAAEEAGPSFYAPFDGSATASICDGGAPEPTSARGLQYVPGVVGEAVYVGGFGDKRYEQAPLLEYDAGEHFSGEGGTVMFWVSPQWDGYFADPANFDTHFLFSALGGREPPDFTRRFCVGSPARVWKHSSRADAAPSELRIYRRELTDAKVVADCRHITPVDFALGRRYLRAGECEGLALETEPAPVSPLLSRAAFASACSSMVAGVRWPRTPSPSVSRTATPSACRSGASRRVRTVSSVSSRGRGGASSKASP